MDEGPGSVGSAGGRGGREGKNGLRQCRGKHCLDSRKLYS
jgi:hypothetical protein